jgi:hypothetical protein
VFWASWIEGVWVLAFALCRSLGRPWRRERRRWCRWASSSFGLLLEGKVLCAGNCWSGVEMILLVESDGRVWQLPIGARNARKANEGERKKLGPGRSRGRIRFG